MEAAGLAIGVAGLVGLFSACLDVVEKVDSYRDFGVESDALLARFQADKIRFRQWGQDAGIDQDKLTESHNKRLDDVSVRSAIDQILRGIKGLVGEIDRSALFARELTGLKTTESNSIHLTGVNLEQQQQRVSSRRSRLGWALRGKARYLALVESFDVLVQKLYDLVPPAGSKLPSLMAIGGKEANFTSLNDIGRVNSFPAFGGQGILIELEKHLENELRKDLDAWLESRSTHSAYDNFVQRRLHGTCDWILDQPEFLQWQIPIIDNKAKLLWVHGHAGYGKTFLAARMIEHLSASPNTPLAYFFFSAGIVDASDPFVIMRSWISQLVNQNRQAFELAQKKWETTEGRNASRTDVKDLFKAIAQNISNCTFVVDGLDECIGVGYGWQRDRNDALLQFFDVLKESLSGENSRVMVVSRNEREIRQGFDLLGGDKRWNVIEFQIRPQDVKCDATQYSRSILDYKLTNKSEEDRENLSHRMVERCESMFLGIRMLEDDLNGGKNIKQLQRIIDRAPYRLEHIYDRSWDRINNLREDRRKRAYAILRWVTFSLRPMTIVEITEALLLADEECEEFSTDDLPDRIDELYIKEELLELCASLIEIRQTGSNSAMSTWTIHHVHISVRQYLLCHMLSPPGYLIMNENLRRSNEGVQSNILAKTCIRYINSAQIWNETEGDESIDPPFRAFRDYSIELWHQYFNQDTANSGELVLLLNSLFRPGNANWESWRKLVESILQDKMLNYEQEITSGSSLFYASLLGLTETMRYLLDEVGMDVNHVDESKRTAILAACSKGWFSGVQMLLHRGASVLIASSKGRTPVYVAASNGHLEIVKLLVEEGADITTTNNHGWTPLNSASDSGHFEIVKLLVERGANIAAATENGWTPLHSASSTGHFKIVELLVERGANIAAVNDDGWTPLYSASSSGHFKIVKLLLEKGADIATTNKYGWTPLNSASYCGHFEIAKLLVEMGANISTANKDGLTPLHSASASGHLEIVQLLLEKGADITTSYQEGLTPLHLATSNGHVQTAKMLLEKGADITATNQKGLTPLHLAAFNGHVQTTKMLLEKEASTTAENNNGWMPLNLAAYNGHAEIVKLFLEIEADKAIENKNELISSDSASQIGRLEKKAGIMTLTANGWTPLKSAAYHGNPEIVKLLLDNGADIHDEDHIGRPALFYAIKADQTEIFTMLLSHEGIRIDSKDYYGSTALSVAARYGREEMVKKLTALSFVEAASRDNFGRTPLWWAQRQGHTRVVEHLLKLTDNSSASMHTVPISAGYPACFDDKGAWCDVCLASVGEEYYTCKFCNGDDFALCSDCHGIGAHCLVKSHVLHVKKL